MFKPVWDRLILFERKREAPPTCTYMKGMFESCYKEASSLWRGAYQEGHDIRAHKDIHNPSGIDKSKVLSSMFYTTLSNIAGREIATQSLYITYTIQTVWSI